MARGFKTKGLRIGQGVKVGTMHGHPLYIRKTGSTTYKMTTTKPKHLRHRH